jgi:hypothetical protein
MALMRQSAHAHSDAKAGAAFGTATGQYFAAIGGFHAGTETVIALAFQVAWLVGAFGGHDGASINGGIVNWKL